MSPEPVRAAPAPLMVAEPAKPAVAALPDLRPLPPPEPPIAIKPAQEIVPKSAPAITPDHEAPTAPKPKKDEAFYDLESLEAEMARLLGRDP